MTPSAETFRGELSPAELVAAKSHRARQGGFRPPRVAPASACFQAPYWERHDPYYTDWMWEARPLFMPFCEMEEYRDEVTGRIVSRPVPAPRNPDRGGRRAWRWAKRSPIVRRVIAVLKGFHHATSRQLCAAAGFQHNKVTHYLTRLWQLGLLRRGEFRTFPSSLGSAESIWALNDSPSLRRFARELRSELPEDEYLAIFPPDGKHYHGAPHARHNVMVLEVCLRLVEVEDHWTALGPEVTARPDRLCPDANGAPLDFKGDAVLRRRDGHRVVLELVASKNIHHARRKMRKWAEWLLETSERANCTVVFLNAYRREHTQVATALRKAHEGVIAWRLRSRGGMGGSREEIERVARQIVLASWEDWFPSHGRLSYAGLAGRMAVRVPRHLRWFAASLTATEWPAIGSVTQDAVPDPSWLTTPPWIGDLPLRTPDP